MDILEVEKAVRDTIMGARATLDVYEWIGGTGGLEPKINFIDCPRITVRFDRDDQTFQGSIHFHPDRWESVDEELIRNWLTAEFGELL